MTDAGFGVPRVVAQLTREGLIVNKKGIERLMRRGDCKASHGAILRPSQRPLWSIASLSPRSQINALGRRYDASSTWAGFAYLAPNAFEQVNQGKSEQSRVATTAERALNFQRLRKVCIKPSAMC